MSSSFEGVYEPGIVDPGTPIPRWTKPYWHNAPHRLANHQSAWPTGITDILIIGSGMTGTSMAHTITSKRPDLNVVMVDARPLCSGATGRNGGHIKTMSYAVWEDRKRMYGIDEAIRITEFEESHLKIMGDAIRDLGLECDLVHVDGVDAYYDQRDFDKALKALEDMRAHAPHVAKKYKVSTDAQTLQKEMKLSQRCIGAITVPAGSAWPYKMVTPMIGKMITSGQLNVQTNTTVTSIEDEGESDFAIVHTSRGVIKAKKIVHATNGWLGHLLPELRPYVSPVRANVVHYDSVEDSSGAGRVSALGLNPKYSYWFRYAAKDYDYLITREDGGTIVGRANVRRRATTIDSELDVLPMAHLAGFHKPTLSGAPADAAKYIDQEWSGAVAFTQDASPFVGRVDFLPGRSHQFVCGAYHGIGMVKAFRAGQMAALIVLGEEPSEEYPRSMLVTPQRLKVLRRSLEENAPQRAAKL